jgi:hypothetical protein
MGGVAISPHDGGLVERFATISFLTPSPNQAGVETSFTTWRLTVAVLPSSAAMPEQGRQPTMSPKPFGTACAKAFGGDGAP